MITLLTDFGMRDPYVAEMKGTILSLYPKAQIIDISHDVEKFNVRMGAFILASAVPYFPEGTIHIGVVDPGVGTKRLPIIIKTNRGYFVGPDNGLLIIAANREGIQHTYLIDNLKFPQLFSTFHGRDIFAPVAAYLAKGADVTNFGNEISSYIMPKFAKPRVEKGVIFGEIIYIDGFGNLITNIPEELLNEIDIGENRYIRIKFQKEIQRVRFSITYGDVSTKSPLAIIGSHGYFEISVNQGNAQQFYGVRIGEQIEIQT